MTNQVKYYNYIYTNYTIIASKVDPLEDYVWYPGNYGNWTGLFFDKHGNPWITIGPDFPYSMCLLTFVTIVWGVYTYLLFIYETEFAIIKSLAMLIPLVCWGSLVSTMLVNPGHPNQYTGLPKNNKYCK